MATTITSPENSPISLPDAYHFHLVNADPVYPFDIVGYLPEDINMSVHSSWDDVASDFLGDLQGISGGIGKAVSKNLGEFIAGNVASAGKLVDLGKKFGGFNYQTDLFNSKIWNKTDVIGFRLRVYFEAINDAYLDVWQPMIQLQSLVLPIALSSTDGSTLAGTVQNLGVGLVNAAGSATDVTAHLLRPPATQPAFGGGKSNISIRIGNMFYFDDVIVDTVDVQFHTKLDRQYNLPIAGVADISVSTRRVVNFQDYYTSTGVAAPKAQNTTSSTSSTT